MLQVRALAQGARIMGGPKGGRCSEAVKRLKNAVDSAANTNMVPAAAPKYAMPKVNNVASQVAEKQRMLQRLYDNSDETVDITDSQADLELNFALAEQAVADVRSCLQPGSTRLQQLQQASSKLQQLQKALQLQIELETAALSCSTSTASSEETCSNDDEGLGMVTIDLFSSSDIIDITGQAATITCTSSTAADSSSTAAVQQESSEVPAKPHSSWRVVGSSSEEHHKAAAGCNSSSSHHRNSSSSGEGNLKSVFMAASAVTTHSRCFYTA
jgi:hypothetical protein